MTPLETIEGATAPGWPFVYVVGSYDSRITFFSQQARGFNLSHALLSTGVLQGRTRFAVIGAGAAGLAVASGLSLLAPNTLVDVFEREQQPLHLQRGCHQRNLHPHVYEWPREGAKNTSADLPWLNWAAASADMVATEVLRQFRILQAHREGRLHLHLLREVTSVVPIGAGHNYRVSWIQDGREDSSAYGAVFISIGFGRERRLAGAPPAQSYWTDRGVPGPPKYAEAPTSILVTGGGDGGLIDLCAAALEDFDHTALIELVTTWPGIDRFAEELADIDAEAERFGPGFDFMGAYDRGVGPALARDGLIGRIRDSLRRRVRLTFNTQSAHPLEQPTSTLNRLLVYLVIRAAEPTESPIFHLPGEIRAAGGDCYEVPGVAQVEATEVFVRHGSGKAEAFAAFPELHRAYKTHHELWLSVDPARRQPPHLHPDADAALRRAMTEAELPVPLRVHANAVAHQPRRARLDVHTGRVRWGGEVPPEELLSWWGTPDNTLRLELACGPAELGPLAGVIARFAIHASHVRLTSDDPRWNSWLSILTLRSPHAHALRAPTVRAPAGGACHLTVVDSADVAARLQVEMDQWMLREVDRHLAKYLATGTEEANWVVWRLDRELRGAMAVRWGAWQERLWNEPAVLGRVFRLAACAVEDDQGETADREVLVGPHRLPAMLRTLVLTLAAAEAWPTSGPRGEAPGNFDRRNGGGAVLAHIHATGAELIDGEPIVIRAGRHSWRTQIVLLSELTAPAEFEEAADRSFRDDLHAIPRLDTAPGCNLIVGADRALMEALASGGQALSDHLARTEQRLRDGLRAQLDLTAGDP